MRANKGKRPMNCYAAYLKAQLANKKLSRVRHFKCITVYVYRWRLEMRLMNCDCSVTLSNYLRNKTRTKPCHETYKRRYVPKYMHVNTEKLFVIN